MKEKADAEMVKTRKLFNEGNKADAIVVMKNYKAFMTKYDAILLEFPKIGLVL